MGQHRTTKQLLIAAALLLLPLLPASAAYALVGTIGAVSQSAAGSSLTPAWGTSENRTAGNLLICFVASHGSSTLIGTPSGWSLANRNGFSTSGAAIFYKVATGADAAPTISAITSAILTAQLAEFSGNDPTPFDKSGTAAGSSSPATATLNAADTLSNSLLVISSADLRSAARTPTDTLTSNNATITQAGNNNTVSSTNHYSFGYSLGTTSNSSADTAIVTCSVTTSLTGLTVIGASFKPTVPPNPHSSDFLQLFNP